MISEITGEVLYDRIQRHSLLVRVQAICYEIFVPSGIASRLRTAAEADRRNPQTFYTIYYIDGGLGGGHLTPKLVGFLDPLDREFFETFTTVPGVGFMKALKCLVRPINEIARAIERGDSAFLRELPSVGPKIAERIITELHGKMAKFALAPGEEPLSVEEEPVTHPEDIGLVHRGHLAPSIVSGVLECVTGDTGARPFRDHPGRGDHTGDDDVLDTGV